MIRLVFIKIDHDEAKQEFKNKGVKLILMKIGEDLEI